MAQSRLALICGLFAALCLSFRAAQAFDLGSIFRSSPDSGATTRSSAEDELTERLAAFYAPYVRTLNRPIAVYHWTSKPALGLDEKPANGLDPQPAAARKYLEDRLLEKRLGHAAKQAAGGGFYVAVDPAATSDYGGSAPVVFEMALETGTRYLDTVAIDDLGPSDLFKKLKEEGCNSASLGDLRLFIKKESGCNALVERVLKKLGVKAMAYPFVGQNTLPCRSATRSRGIAFVLIDPNLVQNNWVLIPSKPARKEAESVKQARERIEELSNFASEKYVREVTEQPPPAWRSLRSSTREWMNSRLFRCAGDPDDAKDALQASYNLNEYSDALTHDFSNLRNAPKSLPAKIVQYLGSSLSREVAIAGAERTTAAAWPAKITRLLRCERKDRTNVTPADRNRSCATCSREFQNQDLVTTMDPCEMQAHADQEEFLTGSGRSILDAIYRNLIEPDISEEMRFSLIRRDVTVLIEKSRSPTKWEIARLSLQAAIDIAERRFTKTSGWAGLTLRWLKTLGPRNSTEDRAGFESLVRNTLSRLAPELAPAFARTPVKTLLEQEQRIYDFFLKAENQERFRRVQEAETCLDRLSTQRDLKNAILKNEECRFLH